MLTPTTRFTDATFQTALTLSSQNNPFADENGNIQVRPGNRLPGVPRHLFKVGADYGITEKWVVGFSALVASGKFLTGDELNLNPTTGAYGVLNIHSNYQVIEHVQVFAQIENVVNSRYATFGTFSRWDPIRPSYRRQDRPIHGASAWLRRSVPLAG